MEDQPSTTKTDREQSRLPVFSASLPDGGFAEILYDSSVPRTQFAVWRNGAVTYESRLTSGSRVLTPYSPHNTLLEHRVILLPTAAESYGTDAELLARITEFLHRYMDLNPVFERLATYYVLLTWIYDDFNELPYLRVRGDAGSGKTRFLLTLGSLCYKPVFASGASTASPLFRILDICRGTLIIDESDFRFSDEKADIVKILNQGHARGFPVLRSEADRNKEYSPRAYQVFGPKIIATRGLFEDRALESRCLTEVLGGKSLREDIPINLTDEHQQEAATLRNQLLMFRFRHLGTMKERFWIDRKLEPRLNQVFSPLMSIIDDQVVRTELQEMAYAYQAQAVSDRSLDMEVQVLEVIQELQTSVLAAELSVKAITTRFIERFEQEYDRKITPRWIGSVIRQRLGLATERRQGIYCIASTEKAKLTSLYQKFGLDPPG